jgi:hypothetical protein
MAISVQAIHGIEGSKTIRLKGHLSGKDVFMLIDLGSSHGFINEETAKCISGWQALSTPAQVQIANGEVLHCTHQQLWGIQGHSFSTTSKILPLQGYDIILGIDWLGSHSPMEIHWVDRWVKFTQGSHQIKLQGISPVVQLGPPVSCAQLQAMDKADSILYMVQVKTEVVSSPTPEPPPLPPELLEVIHQYPDLQTTRRTTPILAGRSYYTIT